MAKFKELELQEIASLYNGKVTNFFDSGLYYVYGANGVIGKSNEYRYENAIVIGRVGAYCGAVNYCKNKFGASDNTIIATVKDCCNNVEYLYYLLKKVNLNNYAGGTAQPLLTQTILNTIKVPFCKNSKIQNKIAKILSNYDDLIENNNKRIKILEEMAQKIYKEWFVDFKFPRAKNATFKDSELGKIPSDWEIKNISDVTDVIMGQSPKSHFYNNKKLGLPFHQGVANFGERFPKNNVYCSCSGRIANISDILLSVRAPVGRINIANTQMIIGRGLAAIKSKYNNQIFLFYSLCNLFDKEDKYGNGAVFNAITKDELLFLKIIYPNNQVISDFEKIIYPIDKALTKLIQKNETLKQTRDILLPRLISGEIDVENLEIV